MNARLRCTDFQREMFAVLAGTLSDAETIRAQVHLEGCADCRARLEEWRALRGALAQRPVLSQAHADRLAAAVCGALDAVPVEPAALPAPVLRLRWVAAAAAVIVFALALLLRGGMRPPPARESTAEPDLAALASGDALPVSGTVRFGVVTLASEAGATVRRVEAGAQPKIELVKGTVQAEITPLANRQSLSLCSAVTCVRVIGTAFRFATGARERVDVLHGVVAVSAREAPDAFVVLHAGESFEPPWQARAETAPIEPEPAPSVDAAAPRCPRTIDERFIADAPARAERCLATAAGDAMWLSLAEAFLARDARHDARRIYLRLARSANAPAVRAQASYALALLALERGDRHEAEASLQHCLAGAAPGAIALDARWRLANLLVQSKRAKDAVAQLDLIVQRSEPTTRKAEAMFLAASIRERELQDVAAARAGYTAVSDAAWAPPELVRRARLRLVELGKP
jgi:hypothetical protein